MTLVWKVRGGARVEGVLIDSVSNAIPGIGTIGIACTTVEGIVVGDPRVVSVIAVHNGMLLSGDMLNGRVVCARNQLPSVIGGGSGGCYRNREDREDLRY